VIWAIITWIVGACAIAVGFAIYWALGRVAKHVGCTRWFAFQMLLCYLCGLAFILWLLWWVPGVIGRSVFIVWKYL